ncbi:Ribonuclease/ribotoxin [Hypoxylon sp. FL1150]|nr:Ribonuclease/ribotoxin [Hypoxylon sp. FL1150]
MQLSSPVLLNLCLALPVSSAVPAPVVARSKQVVDNLPPSDQFVTCPGYRYSRPQVESAIQQGIINMPTSQPQPEGFPHEFGNNRKLPFSKVCNGKKLYEFPLLHGGKVFGGGETGPDRVVFYIYTDNPDKSPTKNGGYCGVMTHDGAGEKNGFALCPVKD